MASAVVRIPAILALILATALTGGCAGPADGPTFLNVPRAQYQMAFDAACDVARAEGLVPELADRQAGAVSTGPLHAGSLLEPWAWPDLTASDVIEGTFGFERRRAHFEFVPTGFKPAAPQGTGPLAGAVLPGSERGTGTDLSRTDLSRADGSGDGALELRVTVSVERQFRPGYQGPAYTRALGSYWRDTTEGDGAEDSESTWTPIARDERFERLLLARIAAKVASLPAVEAPTQP
ncbi:MAG: hypothetical protein RLZZ116_1465 [Planctomycetota bacterium]